MAATASTTGHGYLVPSSSGHESEGVFSRLIKAIAGSREQRGNSNEQLFHASHPSKARARNYRSVNLNSMRRFCARAAAE